MSAPIRDWSDPFLEQAREDLRAAWAVSAAGGSPSTLCMLIQMVFEKLAKAAYARSGQGVLKTHKAASHLFAILSRHPVGKNLLMERPNVQQFIMDLENAHPSSVKVERKIWIDAHPGYTSSQVPVWPQLEYPWEDEGNGTVHSPARDLSLARRVNDRKDLIALDCLIVASALEKQLTSIVP